MPLTTPAFLSIPGASDPSFARIRRKFRLFLLRELLLACAGDATPRLSRKFLSHVAAVVSDAARRKPDAVLDVLGGPDVACHLLTLASGMQPRGQGLEAALIATLVGLAQGKSGASLLSESLLWQGPVERLVFQHLGVAVEFSPPATAFVGGPAGVDLELPSGAHVALSELVAKPPSGVSIQPAFHAITAAMPSLCFSEVDTNPLANLEAHPDKHGNALSLGSRPLPAWTRALSEALELIHIGLPTWFSELPLALERLLPVGYEPEAHLSASYREVPGIAYITLHPNPVTLAEAIVHETQHGKLNVLSWLDAVLENGYDTWTPSPVRPDLRPLMGVLLAVHAFVPVSALHLGLVQAGHPLTQGPAFERRRHEVLAGNSHGLRVVRELAIPTKLGKVLLDDLERVHQEVLAAAPAVIGGGGDETDLAALG